MSSISNYNSAYDSNKPINVSVLADDNLYNYLSSDNGDIDYVQTDKLERTPEKDMFCSNEYSQFVGASVGKVKAPSGSELLATVVMIKEAYGIISDAIKSGQNIYEAITGWISNNKTMSDTEKVKALQIGNALAKEMSVDKVA